MEVLHRLVDEPEVVEVLGRLMATVAVIIIYSYEKVRLLSLEEATGISQDLIRTNVQVGVEELLEE
jgi:hypothetical protein